MNIEDYLPCASYENQTAHPTTPNFAAFFDAKSKRYFFALLSDEGKTLLKSEGYPQDKARENGIKSVLKNKIVREHYSIKTNMDQYYVSLRAGNHQEIARSCEFATEAEAKNVIAQIFGEVAKPAKAAKVTAPKVEKAVATKATAVKVTKVAAPKVEKVVATKATATKVTKVVAPKVEKVVSTKATAAKVTKVVAPKVEKVVATKATAAKVTKVVAPKVEKVVATKATAAKVTKVESPKVEKTATKITTTKADTVTVQKSSKGVANKTIIAPVVETNAKYTTDKSKTTTTTVYTNAVATTTKNVIKQLYLPCDAYLGKETMSDEYGQTGYALFTNEVGQFLFVVYNADGSIYLRSEAFATELERNHEFTAVKKYILDGEKYQVREEGAGFSVVLLDEKNNEVARSCSYETFTQAYATTPKGRTHTPGVELY
jgi:uncharacterized protein YegP (UPF0339 family)